MQAVRCSGKIGQRGRLVLAGLGLKENTPVEVIILVGGEGAELNDVMSAAESSLGFWDNPIDDEVWNNA